MARAMVGPARVEFESPLEVTPGGKYELICWGDSVRLHPDGYVDGTQPGMSINGVEYVVNIDLVAVGNDFRQKDFRAVKIDRRHTTKYQDYTNAAHRKAEMTLIPAINVYLKEHPEFVEAGHRARLSESVRLAEVEVEKASEAFNAATAAYHVAIEAENALGMMAVS